VLPGPVLRSANRYWVPAGMVKLRPVKFKEVMPVAATVVAPDVATKVHGAAVTSVDVPESAVAVKYSCQMDPFSVVVHQFPISVRFTGKGLVLFSTKVMLDGPPSELPPLYGGLGRVVMVVCAWSLPTAKKLSKKLKDKTHKKADE
ncbi:MAG TPA: hypothetical protein DCQ34_09185, partial [Chitinophagaceae bacterium]|nr:hypothetical protein [Chitinophagaceae bacterium]